MDRNTAEAFVYRSYLEAQPHLSYEGPDSGKRHPELTRSLLQSMATDKQILVTGSKGINGLDVVPTVTNCLSGGIDDQSAHPKYL